MTSTLALHSYQIEDYLRGKGLKIRRRGSKAEIYLCPFCNGGEHGDKWKCVVYLDGTGGNYKCMRGGCSATGSFWQLAQHFGDDPKNFYELNGNGNGHKRHPLTKKIEYKTEQVEPQKLTDAALEYLTRRGFGPEVLDDVAIWCDETGMVNFGYYYKGDLCMVKVRQPRKPKTDEQKAWQKWKGGLRTLWGLEQCDFTREQIVITFGEYDRIALRQAGIQNAVSVPCGDSDLEWISVCYDELQKFQEIILWIDGDKSGQEALPKIAERLGKEKIRVVKTDYKDANEMLVVRGREVADEIDAEINDAVYNAEWYYNGDLVQLVDIPEPEFSFVGYNSGFHTIDKALGGFLIGRLTVHTGDSKHGKSSGVNQMVAMAIEQGGKVCVWPGEDNADNFKYNFYVHLAGWDGCDMHTSQRTGGTYAKVKNAYKDRIDSYLCDKIFVLDKRFGVNEEVLFENFELAFKRHGCDVFVIDNLMKLVASKDTENVNFRQARIINRASDFAKDHNVHLHVVTHTNKMGSDTEPPTKKNVSGAKEITNLADTVLAWWRIPEAVRHNFESMDSVCSILANRVFGDELATNLFYDRILKRYGESRAELDRRYSL